MSQVLAIAGSPRKGANSAKLASAVLEGAAEAGHQTRLIKLREYEFASCQGCERCRKDRACTGLDDGMQQIYPLVERASGLVLISPTHNYNVTALVKAFIDRLYCFYDFSKERPGPWSSRLAGQGRLALVGTTAEQRSPEDLGVVLPAMRLPLEALGYQVRGELVAAGVFPPGAVARHAEMLQQARAAGRELGAALKG
ncbi:MAG: flavodoxin family protein [Desulfarculaceae bacterium]|nr:flavodoxin family protein [Desulfarculaceae bacterium]MCF8071236.1 flavodoxin family protein [Desulfarculaceae bacterium]MCF8101161.1 flavodoxin family protein [Desulfarculaceae bacterium]MCF8115290.1 flavodoxin family protein [Desulfarculaceae bacterium]